MVVRLCASAAPGGGRGHLTRALSLAEATWDDVVDLELAPLGGELSAGERDRALAADATVVDATVPLPPEAIVVVDVPEPTEVAAWVSPERAVVFDDGERFSGEAAIVVQPSAPVWRGQARAGTVLAGFDWAPIGAAWRRVISNETATAVHDRSCVLVCFGGSDPHAVTSRLGPTIAGDPAWDTTIVVGHDYRGPRPDGAHLTIDPGDLPERVAAADVVVLGAGTMKFEVAALGRPALLVAVADDQLAAGPPFAATGAARWLGDGRTIDPDAVLEAVRRLIADQSGRRAMSAAARRAVDGRGADRLATEILKLAR